MYEAIVFLPLLGAIIAGAITLVGARNRLPGEDPPPPHHDHAAPLVPEAQQRRIRRTHMPRPRIRQTMSTPAPRRAQARRRPS